MSVFFASKSRFREIQPQILADEDDYSINYSQPGSEDTFIDEDKVIELSKAMGSKF